VLLHTTEESLIISDYPPPFMDLYLRLLAITFAVFALLTTGLAVWVKINEPGYFEVLPFAVIFFIVAALLPAGMLICHRIRRRRLASWYRTLITGNVSSALA
jgi:uncharacterized membrane protein YhaH (DUF805 family)